PQEFARNISLGTRRAFYADDIGCKPVAIAATKTPAVIRPVARGFQAGCYRLSVIIAECAGYARRKPGLLKRAKRVIELHFEAAIHAADHVVLHRHAGFFRRLRILPGEILIDELGHTLHDRSRFAVLFDAHLLLLGHLDGVELGRALIRRPQVLIDADVRHQALVESFKRVHGLLGLVLLDLVLRRIGHARRRDLRGSLLGPPHRPRRPRTCPITPPRTPA